MTNPARFGHVITVITVPSAQRTYRAFNDAFFTRFLILIIKNAVYNYLNIDKIRVYKEG